MAIKTKKKPVKQTKKIVKEPKTVNADAKVRKKPKYKSFRPHRRIKDHRDPLPSWWELFKKSLSLIGENKKQIAWFFVIYGALNLILVRGIESPVDTESLKETFNIIFDSETATLATGFTSFGLLLDASTRGAGGELAQGYQTILLIISTLALIWLYRNQQAGNKVTMKMAFYRGMYPLIPFVLVLAVIGLQMFPAIVGNFLYTAVIEAGLVVSGTEQAVWLVFFFATVLLSLYMVSSSVIALFIVTLPEMQPMESLRQATELVRYRRFALLRKAFAAMIIVFAILFVVVLPILFIAPALAEWMFFSVTVIAVPLIVGYLFSLYRELL